MQMEGLPEVNPPSGRVPGQGLLTAPILKQRRRRNREGLWKKGSASRVLGAGGNIGEGGIQGATMESRRPLGAA